MRPPLRHPRTVLAHCLALAVLLLVTVGGKAAAEEAGDAGIWVMDINGAIGPAVSDWFTRTLGEAEAAGATLLVVRLDTPGGLDQSMRDMIRSILDSPVPVATYVAPSGSRAASAGTYLLYASHIAAMAPATNLGAATPVQMGGGGPGGDSPDSEAEAPSDGGNAGAMRRKQVNDAVAYIRGLAELRGRNADWAEQAVREAVTLTAGEAREQNVIDLVAEDLDALLRDLEGRSVDLPGGETVTLALEDAQLREEEPDWRTAFLTVITNPSIAYILLLVGIYGLVLEFSNPGFGIPGVLGGICLLLALYALQMLPISYVGLGLMLLGLALIAAEAFSPSFGVLGVGGATAFLTGSIMLMDTDLPAFQIAMPVIAAVGVGALLLVAVTVRLGVKAHRRPVDAGGDRLQGREAVALQDFTTDNEDRRWHGQVRAAGEVWRARSGTAVAKGDRLRVRARHGLTLDVEEIKS